MTGQKKAHTETRKLWNINSLKYTDIQEVFKLPNGVRPSSSELVTLM
jgi:hypothetical protein